MDVTQVIIVAILAVICVAAFILYRGRAKVKLRGPFKTGLELDASNSLRQPVPSARIENSESRTGGATVEDHTGSGASIKGTKVEGDLRAVAKKPDKANHPKA